MRLTARALRTLALGGCLALLLGACAGDNDRSRMSLLDARYALFPADTPLLLQWQGGAGLEAQAALQADAIYARYSLGLPLADTAERIYLGQSGAAPNRFTLLADFGASAPGALTDDLETGDAGRYRGQPLESVQGSDLLLARVTPSVWVIAARAQLEAWLDVAAGAAPGTTAGVLADGLVAFDTTEAMAFAAALPGSQGAGPISLGEAQSAYGGFTPGVDNGVVSGAVTLALANAEAYVETLLDLTGELRPPPVSAGESQLLVDLAGLSANELQSLARTLVADMEMVSYTEAVGNDGNDPWLNFRVGRDPNSIFINFEFTGADARASFEASHLPRGFRLAPLRILASDEPRYYLVLNIYQSSGGLVEGARAEWSVFVADPDTGEPRFLVIQAAAESISADSVNLLTDPEPVSHLLSASAIDSYVGVVDEESGEESTYFRSAIPWPAPDRPREPFAREFAVANDFIYWGNAVADRTLYSASVYNVDAVVFGPTEVPFEDASPWAAFVRPQPVHTLVYQNPLDIVISPWWNLDADYLDVTPEYRQTLLDFKQNFYPFTVQGLARAALRGEGVALLPSNRDAASQVHYRLRDPWALLASQGADTLTPRMIAPVEGEPPDYFLTLTIDAETADGCGARATWSTVVEGNAGELQTLVLERVVGQPCSHPVAGLAPAGVVNLGEFAGQTWRAAAAGVSSEASLEADLTDARNALATLDWIEAAETECWRNGVCHAWFHDGASLLRELQRVPLDAVTVETSGPWTAFVESAPAVVTVQRDGALRAVNPWSSVPAFTADN